MNFDELVKKVNPKIRAIAHRLDGKYTTFSDEDLAQEALLHLWEKNNSNELDDKTLSYIVQGCSFNMRNYIRTHFRGVDRKAVSAYEQINEEGDVLMDLLADNSKGSPEECLNTHSMIKDMEIELTEREKKLLLMSRQGLTTREMGRKLGISHVMVVKIKKKISKVYRSLENRKN